MPEDNDTVYQIKNSLITGVIAVVFSALSAAITISFLLGGANKDIANILEVQKEQASMFKELSNTVSSIDKSQGIMNLNIENSKEELERMRQGFMSLNQDMKCIRIASASNGDITKC